MMQDVLNVALVVNRFYPEIGGAEINLYHQAKTLAKTCQVTVICPNRLALPASEQRDGFSIIRYPDLLNWRRHTPNLNKVTFCPQIFWHLLKHPYDIVHAFPSINRNNQLALWAAKLSGKKFILSSFDFLDYQELLNRHGAVTEQFLHEYRPNFKATWFLKHCDHIFAISFKEVEFFKRFNPNVSYSPVPISPDEFEQPVENPRSKWNVKPSDFVFLVLGRVADIKGQDIALEAFISVKDQLPDAKLVFAGRTDYESVFVKQLKERVDAARASDRVIFTHELPRAEVLGWLKYSQAHIIPVRFMNSGAVVIESWMSGLPVIQSDAVDPNLVQPGVNGYLFKNQDIKGLSQSLVHAYTNRSELPKLGSRGKALVKSEYTYERLIQDYLKVYHELT
jgi:glycosyltransferase involved in cell wall biosynthesis